MPQYSVAIEEDVDDLSGAIVDFVGGTGTIVFHIPDRPIRIHRLFLITAGTTVLTFLDGINTTLSAELVSADSGLIWDFDTKPWFTLTVGNDFMISSSNPVQVSGRVYFTDGIAGTGGSQLTPTNGYVTEDGLIFYVAEDGTTFYVQEI